MRDFSLINADARNLKVEADLRTSSAVRIKSITAKELEAIRQTLALGMINGQNPLRTALDIECIFSDHDLKVLFTVQSYLQHLDKRYLALKLRDKRFDRTFEKAIREVKPIAQRAIERIIAAYSKRLLRRRAEITARTETLQSMNRIEYAANVQLVEEGNINRHAITKEWDDCGDVRVRRSHAGMAQKYGKGKGIPLDEPFILPSGAKLLYPGDQSLGAPAKEIIQCRCRVYYRANWQYAAD